MAEGKEVGILDTKSKLGKDGVSHYTVINVEHPEGFKKPVETKDSKKHCERKKFVEGLPVPIINPLDPGTNIIRSKKN